MATKLGPYKESQRLVSVGAELLVVDIALIHDRWTQLFDSTVLSVERGTFNWLCALDVNESSCQTCGYLSQIR